MEWTFVLTCPIVEVVSQSATRLAVVSPSLLGNWRSKVEVFIYEN